MGIGQKMKEPPNKNAYSPSSTKQLKSEFLGVGWRQEDHEFEASPGYIVRSCVNKERKK
jgi:hypothetical protein